jgi:hypothetical protein
LDKAAPLQFVMLTIELVGKLHVSAAAIIVVVEIIVIFAAGAARSETVIS